MIIRRTLFFFLFHVSCVIPAWAQDNVFDGFEHLFSDPLRYAVFFTDQPLTIDGRGDERSWQLAPWSERFSDIEGVLKPAPALGTRFKMLWNKEGLFIYAEMEEPHLCATLVDRDEIIYHDNDFEVFIDPDDDAQHYFEIEVNALNTIFDLFLPRPYRNGGPAVISWNSAGLKSAVFRDGSINNALDVDKRWTVEMFVPFKDLSLGTSVIDPAPGEYFRINFSRVQWDFITKGSGYVKKVNPVTNRPFPEHNWVWSPQGIVDMHYPERWGYAYFFAEKPGSRIAFPEVANQSIRKFMWLMYYKQQRFRAEKKYYANESGLLGVSANKIVLEKREFNLTCSGDSTRFVVVAHDPATGERWQITEMGILQNRGR